MLFNTTTFLIFLIIVFIVYWKVAPHSLRWGNIVLFIASYIFYGWWDWRFLILIVISPYFLHICVLFPSAGGRSDRKSQESDTTIRSETAVFLYPGDFRPETDIMGAFQKNGHCGSTG